MKDLENRTVFVSGTNRGMGKAMCDVFSREGARLITHTRQEDSEHQNYIKELSERDKLQHEVVCFELGDLESVKQNLIKIAKKFDIDGVVNNAGITANAVLGMTSASQFEEQLKINTLAPFIVMQILSKKMTRNKFGSIVNISSTAAFDGNKGKVAYGASKSALVAMTQTLSRELGPYNIRVNAIAPGITETEMLKSMSPEVIADAVDLSDLRRSSDPEDIAEVANFLLSNDSSFITGEVIRVDGGM